MSTNFVYLILCERMWLTVFFNLMLIVSDDDDYDNEEEETPTPSSLAHSPLWGRRIGPETPDGSQTVSEAARGSGFSAFGSFICLSGGTFGSDPSWFGSGARFSPAESFSFPLRPDSVCVMDTNELIALKLFIVGLLGEFDHFNYCCCCLQNTC